VPLQFLLDTNVISELVRRPRGSVARKISQVGEEAVCTSIVVSCELRFGVQKSRSAKLGEHVETILSAIKIIALDTPVDGHYADIRLHLEKEGQPIGPNDMLIAAHARSLNLTVVTANLKEFQRVPGLEVVNWLKGS